MINDLLVMSRNQQKNALVSETMKANQLWGEVLDNAALTEQMGKSLTVNYPRGPWPLYSSKRAGSALENIVRNALRYSHTKVKSASRWIKTVLRSRSTTTGRASALKTASRSFRPFYRTDERATAGLAAFRAGLAIVESAMQQHRGTGRRLTIAHWVGCGSRCGYRCTSEPKTIGLRMQADFYLAVIYREISGAGTTQRHSTTSIG